ncbi:MAG TPA: nuclear transport factor 2 family protein [Gammaproteobacteria bacterium]|nr:nuclear transport factor 2 family protein [Gammaproteobacteria bacterium]
MENDNARLLAANQAFYDAFASGDFHTLSALWSRSDAVTVIHPGSRALHGRQAVMDSWEQILDTSGGSDIRCEDARAYVHGDYAYVICKEIFPVGRLIATNIFLREDGDWRMLHHQAGPDNQSMQHDADTSTSLH